MLGKIIFNIIVFVHYFLKITLPYKWDFCGLHFERSNKLLINNGSYLIVYAAFLYRFMRYTVSYLRKFSHIHFRGIGRILAYGILISAATQVFWRLYLLTTYFFTGSYYPWLTTLGVLLLNFPPALTVLTSRVNRLQLIFQRFIGFVKNSYFERVNKGRTLPDYSVVRTQIRHPDRMMLYMAENQQIVNSCSEERAERNQANSNAPISFESVSGFRVPQTCGSNGSHGREDNLLLSRISEQRQLKQPTETFKTVNKQLATRQQESVSSSSSIYYPLPLQQSRSTKEMPGASKLSYISKLALRRKEYADNKQKDSKYQNAKPVLAKQTKEIRNNHFNDPILTAAREFNEIEELSKRKAPTEGKIRSTRKERTRMRVAESTAGIHRENDSIQFGQALNQLRTPYRTRSGLIYGPMRR